ncbi:hypothetical protein IF2G_10193 [Cordyceps javanica]|nr:hypothetical protein IF2G_10193 [Cordyceps javanica]
MPQHVDWRRIPCAHHSAEKGAQCVEICADPRLLVSASSRPTPFERNMCFWAILCARLRRSRTNSYAEIERKWKIARRKKDGVMSGARCLRCSLRSVGFCAATERE